jgi:ADP-ribose pyrophosphatase
MSANPHSPQPWKLLSSEDVSPSKWFPIEKRSYQLANGTVVDDFFITTLGDVAMIVPITKEGKVILVNQFKPGYGDLILEFPAGRIEDRHENLEHLALEELEEETGIKAEKVELFAQIAGFTTKATEKINCFIAFDLEFNSQQKFDETELIEVCEFTPAQIEEMITNNTLTAADTIATWVIATKKYPEILKK